MQFGEFRFSTILYAFILLLIAVSVIAPLPQMLDLMQGRLSSSGGLQGEFGPRLLREFLTLLLVLALIAYIALGRLPLIPYRRNAVIAAAVLGYSAVVFALAVARDLPPIVPISGLRIFQYVPMAVTGFYLARYGFAPLQKVSPVLRFYVVVQAPFALYQVVALPPYRGETLFGSRSFGTFSHPNVFGVTLATCMLWFLLAALTSRSHRRRRTEYLWMVVSFCLILLTGSRMALLLGTVVMAYPLLVRFRKPVDRSVFVVLAPLVGLAVLAVASTTAFSGRVGTRFLWDARIRKIRESFEYLESSGDVLFGWGLGLTSNTLNNLVGYGKYPGQMVADSQYLSIVGGFGFIGLLIYLYLILLLALSGPPVLTTIFIVFLVLFSVPYLPLELFPANALLLLIWGILLGTGERWKSGGHPPRVAPVASGVQSGS